MKVYAIGLYDVTTTIPVKGPIFVTPSMVKDADMKLYTEDEIKDMKLKEGYGFIEFEVDEKTFKENKSLYAIEYGIPESEMGCASTFDEKLLTAEEKEEFLKTNDSRWVGINEYTTEREREVNTIDIAQLGESIGMEAKEQTLPNGKVVKSLVWNQENLLKAVKAVKNLSEEGKPVRITGAAPAWLVSALTHTVHPCPVGVYVPQIGKDVNIPQLNHGEPNPEGEVAFKTTEKGDSILIEYNMDLPEGITTYDEGNLPKVVVPEITQGKAVYLSGRGPNYLTVAIAEAYAHTNSSVSLFQPGVGYTCSITHSRSKKLGDLTKNPLGKEEIKEQLVATKEAPVHEQYQDRGDTQKEGPTIS